MLLARLNAGSKSALGPTLMLIPAPLLTGVFVYVDGFDGAGLHAV